MQAFLAWLGSESVSFSWAGTSNLRSPSLSHGSKTASPRSGPSAAWTRLLACSLQPLTSEPDDGGAWAPTVHPGLWVQGSGPTGRTASGGLASWGCGWAYFRFAMAPEVAVCCPEGWSVLGTQQVVTHLPAGTCVSSRPGRWLGCWGWVTRSSPGEQKGTHFRAWLPARALLSSLLCPLGAEAWDHLGGHVTPRSPQQPWSLKVWPWSLPPSWAALFVMEKYTSFVLSHETRRLSRTAMKQIHASLLLAGFCLKTMTSLSSEWVAFQEGTCSSDRVEAASPVGGSGCSAFWEGPVLFSRVCVYLFVLKIALLSFLRIGCRERGAQFVLTFPSSDRFNVLPDSIC